MNEQNNRIPNSGGTMGSTQGQSWQQGPQQYQQPKYQQRYQQQQYRQAPVNPYPGYPTKEQLPPQYRPLSAWAYFGYSLLFSIPLVGFICLIVFSISDANVNRRSFARSYWCWFVIALIVVLILALTGGFAAVTDSLRYGGYRYY